MASGKQIRAGRVLADWDAEDLAAKTGLTRETIFNIERGTFRPRPATHEKIVKAFAEVGIEFIENEGVRRRPEGVEIFEGRDRFDAFYDFLYEHLKQFGGNVCIGNSDPQMYLKCHRGFHAHKKRMEDLAKNGSIRYRILIKEGDKNFTASSYAQYRWQPQDTFIPTSFYAFGECLALITFQHQPAPYVLLIKSRPLAEVYRRSFDLAWEQALPPPMGKGV